MLRYLNAGESHGKGLMGIIEGLPSNLYIDIKFINNELKRRQRGYGRGKRMDIEKDNIDILAGVRGSYTIGSPLSLYIENKDYENWEEKMKSIGKIDEEIITKPRPGHGDFAGAIKYRQNDIRNILERASARETAMRVAVGAIAKLILKEFNIEVYSYVTGIGDIEDSKEHSLEEIAEADNSSIRVLDKEMEDRIIKKIDECKLKGDTLGGSFKVVAKNIPIGLGSYSHWDRKLDGKLAQGLMSLQGIKAVEIGEAIISAKNFGSTVHDQLYYDDGYYRETNNAGGIEAGISNGENIELKGYMKPIPSLRIPLKSIDMKTKEEFLAHKERADVCAVPSASIVAESTLAWIIASEIIIKFGGDSIEEMKFNYDKYSNYIKTR
ncbi:chorismate synthase [Clostridium sp. D2Q-11]|uniref:Chorismate synthase n=1 Tax=Anaeromonas frigoriresistens TaxID=2683708 RepID=A0A942UZX0_9FIRM|nr:chorismate synthase [Anaeromonas frigoriresistens]MBS4540116.1 chorismate synthase [Anaeromonas frigoriresistens]